MPKAIKKSSRYKIAFNISSLHKKLYANFIWGLRLDKLIYILKYLFQTSSRQISSVTVFESFRPLLLQKKRSPWLHHRSLVMLLICPNSRTHTIGAREGEICKFYDIIEIVFMNFVSILLLLLFEASMKEKFS